jgi:type III secretory pathway component EscV
MAAPLMDFRSIRNLFTASDFAVAGVLIVIIALMLIPLPTFILDILLTMNLAFTLVMLSLPFF